MGAKEITTGSNRWRKMFIFFHKIHLQRKREKSGGGSRRICRILESHSLNDAEKVGKRLFSNRVGEKCEEGRTRHPRARNDKKENFSLRWLRRIRRRFFSCTHTITRKGMRRWKNHDVSLRSDRNAFGRSAIFPYAICDRFFFRSDLLLLVAWCGVRRSVASGCRRRRLEVCGKGRRGTPKRRPPNDDDAASPANEKKTRTHILYYFGGYWFLFYVPDSAFHHFEAFVCNAIFFSLLSFLRAVFLLLLLLLRLLA